MRMRSVVYIYRFLKALATCHTRLRIRGAGGEVEDTISPLEDVCRFFFGGI